MKFRYLFQASFLILFFLWIPHESMASGQPGGSGPLYPYKDVGDGQPATSVILTLVDGMAVDKEGTIYLSHRSKNRIRKVTRDGIITTVAGTGIAGYGGDGGPALQADLNFPAGLALDADGNLYVADRNNHRVRKIDKQGIIITVAGTGEASWNGDDGPATEAALHHPSDLEVDGEGSLYISDRSNSRIRKVDAGGIITTIAGMGLPDFGGDYGLAVDALLKYPFGICLDRRGNLYIADRGNNRVRKVDGHGIITTVAGDGTHSFAGDYGPANQSSLAFPTDVVVDDSGNLYIADRNNNRVRMVDPLGVIITFMGTGKSHYNGDNEIAAESNLHLPFALAIDHGQNLMVADRNHFRVRSAHLKDGRVKTVAGNGKSLFKGDGGPGRGATLDSPSGIVVDGKGNVLFAEKNHHRIRRLDRRGFITTLAGSGREGNEGDGGPALQAALFLPSQMAIDPQGNIYFASRVGNGWVVRKIDGGGTITRFAGNGRQGNSGDGGPALQASFYTISDVVTDRHGNVYISDQTSGNIRKVDRKGRITSVLKDKLADLAEEVHVNGLVVDEEGNLFFSDSGSSKIRKIDLQGNVTDVAGTGDFEDHGDGGPALEAGVRSPGGLVIGPGGSLYVAESQSSRIRKIDKDGVISRVAGTGVAGFSGDGGPAIQAQIKTPDRMAFDAQGNLFFTDRDNNRVRKIDPHGIISTVAGHGNFGWMQDGLEVRITVHNFP